MTPINVCQCIFKARRAAHSIIIKLLSGSYPIVHAGLTHNTLGDMMSKVVSLFACRSCSKAVCSWVSLGVVVQVKAGNVVVGRGGVNVAAYAAWAFCEAIHRDRNSAHTPSMTHLHTVLSELQVLIGTDS